MPSGLVIDGAELVERFSRSSGPGGQGVNTTDSRVELTFDPAASSSLTPTQIERVLEVLQPSLVQGRLVVAASEYRSQLRNRAAARERLANLLRDALAPPPPARRPTRPTRGSQRRRLDAKKRRGNVKSGRGRVPPE
ncbi:MULTISPECIES: alternative ribosome rescue aminoacyl-tRNA hydrolase ArfB [unclassified Knoellia]|uniref:alternative ribosome rescue aminoacyl-tRNA hydrolase ArfB n=1 Tax=Knoellia altitudinis TaxID=3404795 RepID=UPI0036228A64